MAHPSQFVKVWVDPLVPGIPNPLEYDTEYNALEVEEDCSKRCAYTGALWDGNNRPVITNRKRKLLPGPSATPTKKLQQVRMHM